MSGTNHCARRERPRQGRSSCRCAGKAALCRRLRSPHDDRSAGTASHARAERPAHHGRRPRGKMPRPPFSRHCGRGDRVTGLDQRLLHSTRAKSTALGDRPLRRLGLVERGHLRGLRWCRSAPPQAPPLGEICPADFDEQSVVRRHGVARRPGGRSAARSSAGTES